MTLNAFVKLVTVSAVFSAVVLTSIIGRAQDPTPTANWVNIKSPAFAAYGDGKHDDTAAIQAAIDYAFAHDLAGVYCPTGTYKTSSIIYLDPPNDLRVNFSAPPASGQFTMAFFGDPTTGGAKDGSSIFGCVITPTFNNRVALISGPGQGMRVSDIAVIGPNNGYRANLNAAGVGIGIAGGNAGAATTLIEHTYVANFYTLYMTNANQACCLADNNTFDKVSGDFGYVGIWFFGTQALIGTVNQPRFGSVAVGIKNDYSHQVNVYGGNISATSGQSNTFAISSIGNFTDVGCESGFGGCFNATIASPDGYIPNVYNSYTIATAHFGVIPLVMLSWNPSTDVALFGTYLPWLFANYGRTINFPYAYAMQDDIAAVTTLYAAERDTVAQGIGVSLYGVHVENPVACTTLFDPADVWGGQNSTEIVNPFFNYDLSLVTSGATTADIYCQQTFPFIGGSQESQNSAAPISIRLQGGNYSNITGGNSVILAVNPYTQLSGKDLGPAGFNLDVFDSSSCAYGQIGNASPFSDACYGSSAVQFATIARGAGRWDQNYFMPSKARDGGAAWVYLNSSEMSADYCGYEPCPDRTPNLSPSIYTSVSGTLGALGTYPPIACRTVFKSVDWDTGALSHLWLRSASCPGYSYGQSLTNALVGGTITYQAEAGSDVLYLDSNTLGWMFPGLGITIGSDTYTVTGVYPYLGYVTVISTVSTAGGPLVKNYSCSSSCSIGQAPFAWTAY